MLQAVVLVIGVKICSLAVVYCCREAESAIIVKVG